MNLNPLAVISLFTLGLLFIVAEFASANDSSTVELNPYFVEVTRLDPSIADFSSFETEEPGVMDSIDAILNQFSGVYFNESTGFSGNTELMVRGGEANFTKVILNGIEVNNPTDSRGGGYNFAILSGLPVSQASINKGALSAISGSGSLAGILSLEMGSAFDESYIAMQKGAFGYLRYNAVASWGTEIFGIEAGSNKTEETVRYRGHDYENKGGFLNLRYQPVKSGELLFSAWTGDTFQERLPDDSGGLLYAGSFTSETVDSENTGISLRYGQNLAQDWRVHALLGHYSTDVDTDSPGVAGGLRNPFGIPANRFKDEFARNTLEISTRYSGMDFFDIAVGFSAQTEDAKSDSVVDIMPGFSLPSSYDIARDLTSFFAEASYEWREGHFIELSERLDKISNLDSELSSGMKYGIRSDMINGVVYLGYSEAFKAPSIFALNNGLVGNPNLKPESGDTVEFGFNGASSDMTLSWKAAVFSQQYRNLIDMSEVTQTLINLSSVEIRGVEASVSWKVSKHFGIVTSATLLDLDLGTADEVLRFRPEQMFDLALVWASDSGSQSRLRYGYTGKRWDSSIPTGNVHLKADQELSFSWIGNIHPNVQLTIDVRNLLNQDDEILIGYEKSETSFSVGIKWSMPVR